jgi:flagellar protein FlaJ
MEARRERLSVVAIITGLVFLLAGSGVAALVDWLPAGLADLPAHLWTIGSLAFALGAALAFQTDVVKHIFKSRLGGERYELMKRGTRLRAWTILARALIGVAIMTLGLALVIRMNLVSVDVAPDVVQRAVAVQIAALAIAVTAAHLHSLFVPIAVNRSELRRVTLYSAAGLAILLAVAISYGTQLAQPPAGLGPADLQMGSLLAVALLATAMAGMRGLPGIGAAITDPGRITAGGYAPDNRQAATPVLVAFTILSLFVAALLVLSAGLGNVLQQAGENRLLALMLAFILAAAAIGLVLSFRLSKETNKPTLFNETTDRETRKKHWILYTSLPVAGIMAGLALALKAGTALGPIPVSGWLHILSIALLVGLGPYGYYAAKQQQRIRLMEERFPDLLRDLASSHKGGLTMSAAVTVSARGDYGPLSPEVEKMADQLSWNVSFDDALAQLADRVRTPLVRRTISLILEATRSGGNTTDVLLAAAREARELKILERQRRLNMSVYTIVIYVTFFVFLFVTGVLYDRFVPAILDAGTQAAEQGLAGAAVIDLDGLRREDYRAFYFSAAIVQALGNGILAGVMGSGKAVLGLRHAFWMVLISYLAFGFVMQ